MSQRSGFVFEASKSSPVIVATDGREQSDGAVRAGALFGGHAEAWRIVSASPLINTLVPELDLGITAEASDVLREEQRRSVEDQIRRILGKGASVDVQVGAGDPALVVAAAASKGNASLVVCGLGRHKIVDRLLGDETALTIIRSSEKPVLAVPQDFGDVPRTAVIGIDFSGPSVHAAEFALRLTRREATIYLMNVAPRDNVLSMATGGFRAYEEEVMPELESLRDRLEVPPRMHLQAVVRQGDPGSELLRYAEEAGAELIAVGTSGRGFVKRLLLGSVATKVVRASPVPVLTIAGRDGPSVGEARGRIL
jgi:nucleotide-binding universal stress UspA family protein